ncbi:alpha-amylase family protein [Listeria costaricensis]|uniref:alpha-amylase family protein n=1 Tax=Listeria costaricensis TaxID=2026604 RepID=UPI0013C3E81A|nr:alpha-amylase family protein [Listeria costaricensis]
MDSLAFRQLHLDFHTPELGEPLAARFDRRAFQETLQLAEVDSITLTARCHHGYLYYDSQLPARHPDLTFDLLMEQIAACHEVGIRAPVYVTVGWDALVAEQHPEWLERKPDGSCYGHDVGQLRPGWKKLCLASPYIFYLKEQLADLIAHVGTELDGLFFDIVWQDACYCNHCLELMKQQGIDAEDEQQVFQFAKQVAADFKQEISRFVWELVPDCPIFYNDGNMTPDLRASLDAYSHLEIESLPSSNWGYHHFPVAARYARTLGKEYLGMTGKFHKGWADFGGYKNRAALEYECFLALALGAKCSIGDQLYPDGVLQKETYARIGEVYRTVKKMEPYCQAVAPLVECAVFYQKAQQKQAEKISPALTGAVRMLNEAHIQFDVVDQEADFASYPLLILPDDVCLTPDLSAKIDTYMTSGGKVIFCGQTALTGHLAGSPVEAATISEYEKEYFKVGTEAHEHIWYGRGVHASPCTGSRTIADLWRPYFNRTYRHYYGHFDAPPKEPSGFPAIVRNQQASFFSHPVFTPYANESPRIYRSCVMNEVLAHLGRPIVDSRAPSSADLLLNEQKQHNRYLLHVLHYIPEQRARNLAVIEDGMPLCQQEVTLHLPKSIKRVALLEAGTELPFVETAGSITFTIPEVLGHEMVILTYEP